MTLARNTVIPDSDQTKYILLNSVGDMEFLSRPADNSRWHLTDIIITVDTPGTDTVNVTIKSDMNIIAVIPINKSVSNIATSTGIIGNFGEPINVEIDAAINVHFTASYYQRKDGTMFNPLSDPFSPTDVANITTTLGTSTNMLRVAAAGGLEYRTTAQVLSDIGAAPLASPTFTGTVTLPTTIASVIKPASDSTTALQLANAAGAAVLTVDTTNGRVGVGVTPTFTFDVLGTSTVISQIKASSSGSFSAAIVAANTAQFQLYAFGSTRGGTSYGGVTTNSQVALIGTSASSMYIANSSQSAPVILGSQTILDASTTAAASLRIRNGVAPTVPNNGDIWNDGTDFNLYGGGLKLHTGIIKPASDSTTALQLTNAAGAAVLTVDTTNKLVNINASRTDSALCVNPGGLRNGMYITGESSGAYQNALEVNVTGTSGTEIRGFTLQTRVKSGSSVTSAYGGYISSAVVSGTASNVYGLYVANQTGGASNNYAIYTGTGLIRFGGIVNFAGTMGNSTKVVGTDAPADWVEVQIGGTTYYLPAYAA